MEVIVMRHEERDYEPCHERGFIGQGYRTRKGRKTNENYHDPSWRT